MKTVREYLDQYNNATNEVVKLAKAQSEQVIRWKPSDTEWSLMELLCHVEELSHYWIDELRKVVQSPGTAWGRGLDHADRLAAVAEAPQRSLQDVLAGIEKAQQKVNTVFSTLKQEDLDIVSPHRNPKFGEKDMHFLVDHFISGHMDVHQKQAERILHQYQEQEG